MSDLISLLLETGLIQFGRFGEQRKPYHLHLDLLPSYPDVLRAIVMQAVPLVSGVDRLVCVNEALPFGVGLSLETEIPLVYSRRSQAAPVYDLAGAYDIGHPSLMIANCSDNLETYARFAEQSRRVGSEISRLLVIIDEGNTQAFKLEIVSLLKMTTIVDASVRNGYLPDGQAQLVRQWLDTPH